MPMVAFDERYELGRRIGGGGMAEVFEAFDHKLARQVAVKLLRHTVDDRRARERFTREAQMLAGFTHPNVVTVYDVSETNGQLYLVMELVEGRTLAEVIAETGPLSVRQALAVSDALLAALGAAHERGLVHRDVKPANVLIARDGHVKLADFGIAIAIGSGSAGLTATGQVMGTPTYLSPEQVDGHEATPRTDLYAVGVVLYEMLAGHPPFGGDNAIAVALAHRSDRPQSLDAARGDLPPGLASVVARALEKDPADRYDNAFVMRDALRSVAGGVARERGADPTVPTALPTATQTLPAGAAAAAAAAAAPDTASEARRPPGPTRRTGPKRTRPVSGRVLALVILVGVVAALLIALSGGSPQRGVGRDLPFSSVSAEAPTRPSTTTTVPTTIDGLIAVLLADPDAFGPRGDDLLEGLLKLRDHPDPKGKKTEELARDVDRWVSDGELDPGIGGLTLTILGVAPNRSENGHGEGKD